MKHIIRRTIIARMTTSTVQFRYIGDYTKTVTYIKHLGPPTKDDHYTIHISCNYNCTFIWCLIKRIPRKYYSVKDPEYQTLAWN